MSPSSSDIHRQLYENAPGWLSNLRTFTGDLERRKSCVLEGLQTPELSEHITTTAASSSDSITAGSVPGYTRRAGKGPAIGQQRQQLSKLDQAPREGARLREKNVIYDSTAQQRLADTVKGISRVTYNIKKNRQDDTFKDTRKRLIKASDICEDGAFELLKNGNCRRQAQHALAILEHLYGISRGETMQEQLAQRLRQRSVELMPATKDSAPVMPKLMVDDTPMDDDDGQLDISLPAIRLTSRGAR